MFVSSYVFHTSDLFLVNTSVYHCAFGSRGSQPNAGLGATIFTRADALFLRNSTMRTLLANLIENEAKEKTPEIPAMLNANTPEADVSETNVIEAGIAKANASETRLRR